MSFVDPKFAAGRGEDFSASRKRQREEEELETLARLDDQDFRLPMSRIENAIDLSATDTTFTLTTFLPETNVGYRMLQKMGWKVGTGLGRDASGITEPVPIDASNSGIALGLGRAEVEKQYTDAELIQRRALETELQAFEDEERAKKREIEAGRQQKIREDVTEQLRVFYCEACRKQYSTAMDLEAHLSSYDHHHTKRMADTRAMMSERSRKDRGKKEKRQQEKEVERLNEQLRRAQQAQQGSSDVQPPPPEDAPPPLPPSTQIQTQLDGGATLALGLDDGTSLIPPPPPLPPLDTDTPPLPPVEVYDPLVEAAGEEGGGFTGWQVRSDGGDDNNNNTSNAAASPPPDEEQVPAPSLKLSLGGGVGGGGLGGKKPAGAGKGAGIFGESSSDYSEG